ncbi:response regulator, partial [bacterium]|nr:response regulator [bacterium]
VTERKQLEQRLLQSQKMEAIGSLAGGIAHDFNNILMATMGYAELVRSQLPPGGDLFNQQTQIIQASIRAKELINQILSFSRRTKQEKQSLFIAPIVKEAIKLLNASIPKNIEIRSFIDADEVTTFGDPTQMHQVIMNLCTNAYHAMREQGGVMTVSLSCKPLKNIEVNNLSAMPENLYSILTISDTGKGMDESTLARVFEPYFSTKKKGDGTGLGLSVVHGIIQDHHGMIDIKSELGKGTTVTAAFPVLAMQGERSQNVVEDLPLGDNERIMVIDDEWPIVEMMKMMLSQLRYKPDGFVSCRDALDVFRKNPDHYHLIVTDLSMPHLSGIEVAKKILEIRPDMPVLLCTGYVDQAYEKMIESVKISDVLLKPILQKDAAEAIHRCLHQPTFH